MGEARTETERRVEIETWRSGAIAGQWMNLNAKRRSIEFAIDGSRLSDPVLKMSRT
jgi:hypothetical protein